MSKENPIKAVMVGAGERGISAYGKFAFENPQSLKFVAVVEPVKTKRDAFGEQHSIPKSKRFKSVKSLIKNLSKIPSRVAINATSDKAHLKTTLPLIRSKFTVLLEKPMATTRRSCMKILNESKKYNTKMMICHELRYTPFFTKVKKALDQNQIGKLRTIEHEESVGDYHFSHSYVRGNWSNKKTSGPITLTKTCHDFDLIDWFTGKKKLKRLTSYSDPLYFAKKNAPYTKVPSKCHLGCKYFNKCKYAAQKYYLDTNTPSSMRREVAMSMEPKDIQRNLMGSPYGRCVYRCNNNVPDFQVTNMIFDTDVRAHLTMTARNTYQTRKIRIIGSKGQIYGDLVAGDLTLENYEGTTKLMESQQGIDHHGGGDNEIMKSFIKSLQDGSFNKSTIEESLNSHMMAFAAEKSRLKNFNIDFPKFLKETKNYYFNILKKQ